MSRNPLAWLSEVLLTITAIPLLAMMVQVTLDVVLKYTINAPFQGTLEVTSYYYMVAIVVLPMAYVELTQQSIAVDLIFQMMPRSLQVALTFLVLILSAVAYGGLAWFTWPDAIAAFHRREIVMGAVRVYIWPARFLLPLSMGITAIVCLMHAGRMIVSAKVRSELLPSTPIDPDSEVN